MSSGGVPLHDAGVAERGDERTRDGPRAANVRRDEVDVDMACPRGIDAAVYLLDGLDAAEREEFARHLAGCCRCRAEVDALAPIASLLAIARQHLGLSGWS